MLCETQEQLRPLSAYGSYSIKTAEDLDNVNKLKYFYCDCNM